MTVQTQFSETISQIDDSNLPLFIEKRLIETSIFRDNEIFLLRDLELDYRSTFGVIVSTSHVKIVMIRILAYRIGRLFKGTQVERDIQIPYNKAFSKALLKIATQMFCKFRIGFKW